MTKREWDDAESKDHAPLEGADLETYFALTGCVQYAATIIQLTLETMQGHLLRAETNDYVGKQAVPPP